MDHIKVWKIDGHSKHWTELVPFKRFPKWTAQADR